MNTKNSSLKEKIHSIVFESDTQSGRLFDKAIIVLILLSLLVVMLDSVESISKKYHTIFFGLEWILTILFTAEYLARVYCAPNRLAYVLSFFGIIDLLAITPTYLTWLFPELHSLLDVRVLRLIRVFRVFKLTEYFSEYNHLAGALAASRNKILVFLSVVLMVVLVMGTFMYVVEGADHGFTSIPVGIYWAITTMTTVGFGDLTPKTDLGRFISSIMMLMGWGTLAVPTGIVTAEMSAARARTQAATRICQTCGSKGHELTDKFCRDCGSRFG